MNKIEQMMNEKEIMRPILSGHCPECGLAKSTTLREGETYIEALRRMKCYLCDSEEK